jgi:hypothetical protein
LRVAGTPKSHGWPSVTADRAETVTGVQSNQIANAVPYTGADRTVNIGNNDLIVSNSVFCR